MIHAQPNQPKLLTESERKEVTSTSNSEILEQREGGRPPLSFQEFQTLVETGIDPRMTRLNEELSR